MYEALLTQCERYNAHKDKRGHPAEMAARDSLAKLAAEQVPQLIDEIESLKGLLHAKSFL